MMKKLFLFLFAFLLVINVAHAAIGVNGEFEINGEYGQEVREVEINNGESIDFIAAFTSTDYPITYEVSLRDNEGELVYPYTVNEDGKFSSIEVDQEGLLFSVIYTIEPDHYNNEVGEYNILIYGRDSEGESGVMPLYLNVIEDAPENHAPEVTDITGYDEINSGIINFEAEVRDVDEDDEVERVEFQLFNNGGIIDTFTDEDGANGWSYSFDSIVFNYKENVNIRARAFDGEIEGEYRVEGPFIINNRINHAPTIRLLNPEDGAEVDPLNVELSWIGEDEDGDRLNYAIYINGELYLPNTELTSIHPINLEYGEEYEWYIIVDDNNLGDREDGGVGYETRSNPWSFTTIEEPEEPNQAPVVEIKSPRENQRIDGIYNIRWNAEDVDGEVVNIKLYYKNDGFVNKYLFFWFDTYNLLAEFSDDRNNYDWDTTQFRNEIYNLKIVVTDNDNAEGEDIVNKIRIFNKEGPRNNAPKITSTPITEIVVNTQYKYDVNARDVDGDEISYSLVEFPNGMGINANMGLINWLPREVGEYEVIVRAIDEHGAYDSQEFTIKVLSKKEEPRKEPKEIHEFSISNIMLDQDNEYIQVYVWITNKGNQEEDIILNAYNMITGDMATDSFELGNNGNQWSVLYLPKPSIGGEYTIGVWGDSDDFRDIIYRGIVV